jgi:hypothetical protein
MGGEWFSAKERDNLPLRSRTMYLLALNIRYNPETKEVLYLFKVTSRKDITLDRIMAALGNSLAANTVKGCFEQSADRDLTNCKGFGVGGGHGSYVEGNIYSKGSQSYRNLIAKHADEVIRL